MIIIRDNAAGWAFLDLFWAEIQRQQCNKKTETPHSQCGASEGISNVPSYEYHSRKLAVKTRS